MIFLTKWRRNKGIKKGEISRQLPLKGGGGRSTQPSRDDGSAAILTNPLHPLNPIHHSTTRPDDCPPSRHDDHGSRYSSGVHDSGYSGHDSGGSSGGGGSDAGGGGGGGSD